MSRIGKSPVLVADKVTVSSNEGSVYFKGPKGNLSFLLTPEVDIKLEGNKVIVKKLMNSTRATAMHGLYRALVQNAMIGVSSGFTRVLELHGVGYRASMAGRKLELSLGFSHPIVFELPEGIEVKVDKQTIITVSGCNKELVGQVSAKLRGYRPPEPYLGKGVRYSGEKIRKKAGKSAGK